MEGVGVMHAGMAVRPAIWQGRRVLLTGHTGFKGSWLSLWLQRMGAVVHGFALAPSTTPNLFTEAGVAAGMTQTIGDVRDPTALRECLDRFAPEIVVHMAAQALVRRSYATPVETYATNIMGSVHLLDAVRTSSTVRAVLNVTSDKCYEHHERPEGYQETDAMGGPDPYSSSKGCAELITTAYRSAFLADAGIAVATARSGNVIGGGDWSEYRLVPDVLRAFERGERVRLRYPRSTRPWQHVLEPLAGYLTLLEHMIEQKPAVAEAWNFGPDVSEAQPVSWVVDTLAALWGSKAIWVPDTDERPKEADVLTLDSSKARARLGWSPRWSLRESLEQIVTWHRAWLDGADARTLCHAQLDAYVGGASHE